MINSNVVVSTLTRFTTLKNKVIIFQSKFLKLNFLNLSTFQLLVKNKKTRRMNLAPKGLIIKSAYHKN